MPSDKRNLTIALVVFVLLFLAMVVAALTSKYPVTPNPEDYDTDPAAITKEEFKEQLRD